MKMEFAKASDQAELLDFLHAVFCRNNPSHPRFETLYPDLLEATDEAMGRHAIVRMNGRIASCVGMYTMEMQVGGYRVPIAGIGQVSTGAEWLGKGFMSALLKAQLARAREEGAALAWLSGRHDRYAHFGFEVVGLSFRYHADKRSSQGLPRTYAVAHVPATAETVTPECFAVRAETVDGVLEPLARYHARLARAQHELWSAVAPGAVTPCAWALVQQGDTPKIVEWWGTVAGRLEIFAAIAEVAGSVSREESSASRELNEGLRRACAWMGPTCNHLALLNREGVLKAYGIEETEEMRMWDGPEFLRKLFGPEPSGLTHVPFYLPDVAHV